MGYLLDACALLAYLHQEPGADEIEEKLIDGDCSLHAINAYELFKDAIARHGVPDQAHGLLNDLRDSLSRLDDMSDDLLCEAARIRRLSRHMSVPDAVGVAAAARHQLVFLTADHHELAPLQAQGLPVEFFRPPLHELPAQGG